MTKMTKKPLLIMPLFQNKSALLKTLKRILNHQPPLKRTKGHLRKNLKKNSKRRNSSFRIMIVCFTINRIPAHQTKMALCQITQWIMKTITPIMNSTLGLNMRFLKDQTRPQRTSPLFYIWIL